VPLDNRSADRKAPIPIPSRLVVKKASNKWQRTPAPFNPAVRDADQDSDRRRLLLSRWIILWPFGHRSPCACDPVCNEVQDNLLQLYSVANTAGRCGTSSLRSDTWCLASSAPRRGR